MTPFEVRVYLFLVLLAVFVSGILSVVYAKHLQKGLENKMTTAMNNLLKELEER
jgi:hypothetical protein